MKSIARVSMLFAALLLSFGVLSARVPSAQADENLLRLAGVNRFETAALTSAASFAPGAAQGAVIANGRNYPDALSGVSLARAVAGPLLLSETDILPSHTLSELQRVLPVNALMPVYVLGGESAISKAVADQLGSLGYVVIRLAGNDRFQTAKVIAEQVDQLRGSDVDTAYVVSGNSYADALSISPLAGQTMQVLLLSQAKTLSQSVKDYLAGNQAISKIVIVGGVSVVGSDVEAMLASMGYTVSRVAGSDRYDTSAKVAAMYVGGSSPSGVGVASGETFSDALSAGPQLAVKMWPLLLTKKTNIGCIPTGNFLYDYRDRVGAGYLYGGTAVVSTATEQYANQLMQGAAALGNCSTADALPPPSEPTDDDSDDDDSGDTNQGVPGTYGYDGIDKDCSDFATEAEAQSYFESDGGSAAYNVDGLDSDHDGEACEALP